MFCWTLELERLAKALHGTKGLRVKLVWLTKSIGAASMGPVAAVIHQKSNRPIYFVSRRARTAPPVMPALSPSLEGRISTPFMVPGMA